MPKETRRLGKERLNPLHDWTSTRDEVKYLRTHVEELQFENIRLSVENAHLKIQSFGSRLFESHGATDSKSPQCNGQAGGMCPSKIRGVKLLVEGPSANIYKILDLHGLKFVLKEPKGACEANRMHEESKTLAICKKKAIPGIAPGFWYTGLYGKGIVRPLFSLNLGLDMSKNFSFVRLFSIAKQVSNALSHLNADLLMHGKITFENVLIYYDAAFLVDFGDGCALDETGISDPVKTFDKCQNHLLPPAVALKGFPTGEGTDYWSLIMIAIGVIFGRDIPPLNYTDSRRSYVELFEKRQFSCGRTFPGNLDKALRRLVEFIDKQLTQRNSSLGDNECFRNAIEGFLAACLPDIM